MKKLLIAIVVLALLFAISPFFIKQGLIHNFSNVDDYKIFSNYEIKKSAAPQPWLAASDYNKKKLSKEMTDFFDERKTCAFLVIQDGKILNEHYFEDYDSSTISGSFSMAKTVNALLIGKLIEEGKIGSVNDDVKKYVPELTQIPEGKLTIKDVIMMSGNFDWTESYWNIFSMTAESYYGNDLEKLMGKLKLRNNNQQGKLWEYQSCCTQVLGYIIKHASGKSLAAYADEKLWQPLGAEHDALWSTDKKEGIEKSFCCINATARDFARLGQLVLQHGKWNGVSLIDSAWIAQMTAADTQLKDVRGNAVDWYGYQMWRINYEGHEIPYFRGILGQFIFIIPDKNAVVVRLGKKIKRDPDDPKYQNNDIKNYIKFGLELLK